MNEDVFPIEHGDFPVSHVSELRGVSLDLSPIPVIVRIVEASTYQAYKTSVMFGPGFCGITGSGGQPSVHLHTSYKYYRCH